MHQEQRVLLICCVLLFLVFESCYCVTLDSITLNQPLKDEDVLVSGPDADFALGFFSPGNITNRYVGIWYNKVPMQTIVWVANRQSPVTGTTGVLSIDSATGNLILTSGNGTKPIWSTSVPGVGAGASTSSAKLLDTGNLLLVQGSSSNNENVIWQSFDHPTNTLLPYMRLGADLKRGLNWSLTSWTTYEDPGIGQYTYGMDLSGQPQLFFTNGSKRLWRSGPWDGTKWNGVPEMVNDVLLNATYTQNSSEISIVYGILNASLYSRQVVNETTGIVERLTWHSWENRWVKLWSVPVDRCDFYAHCGDYSDCMQNSNAIGLECSCLPGFQPKSSSAWYLRDAFEGCERKPRDNVCNNGEGFVPVYNAKVPDTSNATVDMNLDLKTCEKMCAKNCSCTAYTSATINEGGCMTWYGPLIDIMIFTTGGQTVYIRVDAATLALYSKKSNRAKKIVIIVVVSLSVVLLGISLACWLLMKRRQAKAEEIRLLKNQVPIPESYDSGTWGQEIDESQDHADLPLFDLRTIFAATDDFSSANKLGEGGFGSVYKGRLEDGQEIAVKRLGKNSGQGIDEFKNEVTLIAKLQHRSLVRLLGCSIKQDEKMLIYEYLPNKGLDSFIFNKERGSLLDWRKRFEIIMGIVRGMIYLHRDSRLRIIHRDLKASNVLLDADMNPKISDFGMAKMFGGDELEANTKRVVGTYGYMAPEYAMEGLFSIKSDVFSFGVLLLEIISGKKNSSYYQDNCVNLIGYVWDLWRFGKALEIVDSSLGNSSQSHEVLRCIQVGLLCVQEYASDRPTMSEVSSMLSNETSLPSPGQPAFIFKGMNSATNSSSTGLGNSVNDVTLTVVEAR